MNQKTLLMIGGGCVLLICLCGICAVGAWYFLPGQVNQIIAQLGLPTGVDGTSPIAPVPPQLPIAPLPGAPTTAAPGAPTRAGAPSGGNLFADALSKAKTAQKYRVEFSWVFGATEGGKYTETAFIELSGVVDGKNNHFKSKGGLLSMLSAGGTTFEFIEADGKSYMKGFPAIAGMFDPNTWYIQKDASGTSGFQDFAKPDYYGGFTGDTKPGDFKKVRAEVVDAQPCDVYNYDFKSVQNAAIIGLLGSAKDKQDFSAIDKAEINVWLCADGFVHKYTMEYSGHDQKNPNEKAAMKMNAHMWDFNSPAIRVTAPAGAKPMPGQ